jgi:hypothetical protein
LQTTGIVADSLREFRGSGLISRNSLLISL